jgi:hypothetical protein
MKKINIFFIIPALLVLLVATTSAVLPGTSKAFADPAHCSQRACYELGYLHGKQNPAGTACPSGHSEEFCRGWYDATGTDTCENPNQPAGVPGCPNK